MTNSYFYRLEKLGGAFIDELIAIDDDIALSMFCKRNGISIVLDRPVAPSFIMKRFDKSAHDTDGEWKLLAEKKIFAA